MYDAYDVSRCAALLKFDGVDCPAMRMRMMYFFDVSGVNGVKEVNADPMMMTTMMMPADRSCWSDAAAADDDDGNADANADR